MKTELHDYGQFLRLKAQSGEGCGFAPTFMPDSLFDFQRHLVDWAIRLGKAAIFADCGLGKTLMQLVWAENVVRHENKNVLVVAPLAVSAQTEREGQKFGVECKRSRDGRPAGKITLTNYERLHLFDSADYVGVVCDESSILKNFDGVRRQVVTEFLREKRYRLLCTATAAPNDYVELGTSSEALGNLGHVDMLTRFFKNDQNTVSPMRHFAAHGGEPIRWRFKKHAELPFWKWVVSWARALRKPSDIGCPDADFILPPLSENEHIVKNAKLLPGQLFVKVAQCLAELRRERRLTLTERCEAAARLSAHDRPAVAWCQLNDEGDLLETLIPGARQVSGGDSDEEKEEAFLDFAAGKYRVLITKPRIGGFGLNWQHCAHMTFFPSHSYEQYYQGTRRCWRFGQKCPVAVDIVASEGELVALRALRRKAVAASQMFDRLVALMGDAQSLDRVSAFPLSEEVPSWL